MNTDCCVHQLHSVAASCTHTVHKGAYMCTYMHAQVHSLVRTWLRALYAYMHCTGAKSHKMVVWVQKAHTKPSFVWPVHRAGHTKSCFVYQKCIQNAVLCDFLLVRHARTYSMHTHVRSCAYIGVYIGVYTCTVMSVRIRNHVHTHTHTCVEGFSAALNPQVSVYWFRRNSLKNMWFLALLLHVPACKVPAKTGQ